MKRIRLICECDFPDELYEQEKDDMKKKWEGLIVEEVPTAHDKWAVVTKRFFMEEVIIVDTPVQEVPVVPPAEQSA